MKKEEAEKYLKDAKPDSIEKDLNLMIEMREQIKALV
jgi:hypothetical protein